MVTKFTKYHLKHTFFNNKRISSTNNYNYFNNSKEYKFSTNATCRHAGEALMIATVLCSRNTTLVSGAVLRTRSTTQKKTESLNSGLPCWNLRMNSWTKCYAYSRLEGAQMFHLMLNELSSPLFPLNKHLTRSQPLSQSHTLAATLTNTIPRVLLHITILHEVCDLFFFFFSRGPLQKGRAYKLLGRRRA